MHLISVFLEFSETMEIEDLMSCGFGRWCIQCWTIIGWRNLMVVVMIDMHCSIIGLMK
jgi:hypothetical protein